jgi:type VI secretion system protein ImpA
MDIEPLLQPITPESPCGEDLSYDPGFNELEGLAKGKEAQQFSGSDDPEWQVAAQEPDWKLIRDKCAELLARSKDLRVSLILALALLKLDGVPGLRDGLSLMQRLLREQWEGVYPRLDPDDNNDPTERVNIIASLARPLATFGDPMRFIERLRLAPLSNSVQMGRFSLADITQLGLPAGSTATPPTEAQVEAAFRDTSVDELTTIGSAASDCRKILSEMDSTLMELVGANHAPSVDEMNKVLGEILQTVAPYLPQDSAAALLSDVSPSASGNASPAAHSGAFSGAIASRADVVRAIDQICEYYRTAEPGNPVPLLLRRAQRLVDKDFMALMEDLLPESVSQLSNITGQKRDTDSYSTPAEEPASE